MTNPNYKINGETEKEATDNTYNNMIVSLNLKANEHGTSASISFDIEEGTRASIGITIEEAKQLIDKLNYFVTRAEQFLEQYKEQ